MDNEDNLDKSSVHAEESSIAIGEISVGGNTGDIHIGHTIGYTSEQVSVLLTQIKTTFQPKPFDGRCPYMGLDVFEENDAEFFFGREKLVEDLVGRVKESRTVFVTGPSGSGKSSLVRAGLIYALKRGALNNSERWLYEIMKPGRDPITELGRVVSSLSGTLNAGEDIRTKGRNDQTVLAQWCEIALKDSREKRVLIFIDQFEEVFTQIANEEERLSFLRLLTNAAMMENGRILFVFAMRSDFVSNCATYPELNTLLNRQFIQIGAMGPEELVSAIAQPALRVGLRIDSDLIAQIINDMQGEPGTLPLMQFALKDLFDSQQAKGGIIALSLNDYLQQGGIHKSLERHADHAFRQLSEVEQELARSIFSRLIEIGRGTQDTRRTALFDELIPTTARDVEVEAIVQKLADARLITTDEQAGKDTITISHEKLIDAWPWLKKLVNENRDVIALQNEIASDANEWDEHQQDPSYLYTGARLAYAREQIERKKLILSILPQKFIQAGSVRQRRSQWFLITGISTIIALLAIAVLIFSKQSRDNALLAEQSHMRELVARSIVSRGSNLAQSLLLGIEVFKYENSMDARGLLLDNLQYNPQLLQFLRGHTDEVRSVAFRPDGKVFASASSDSTIILWDMATHQQINQFSIGDQKEISSLAFSPNGAILAVGNADNTVVLWDAARQEVMGQPLVGNSGSINSMAFSPDGKTLATGSSDTTIWLWNVDTHETIGQPLIAHSGAVNSVAFHPDGKLLASGSDDKTILFWDLAAHQPVQQPLTGHTGSVYSLAFSPDGILLASGSDDNTMILWDVATHQAHSRPLRGHFNRVVSVAFSPDGKILASGSYDQTINLWSITSLQRIGQMLSGHSDWIYSIAFSPDGKTLASGSADKTVILWQVESEERIDQLLRPDAGSINSIAFSTNGQTFASGHFKSNIILWDLKTHESVGKPLVGHSGPVRSVAFSPDDTILASASDDETIILWDATTHQPIGQPLIGHSGPVTSVVFNPKGTILASGGNDGNVILWDVETHEPIGPPLARHSAPIHSLAFSPDGAILASGSDDKTIILWNVEMHQPVGQPLIGHTGSVNSVAFSPDGKVLASASGDKTIILWDVDTREQLGQPLTGHTSSLSGITFSPDGKMLISGSYDKTIVLWDFATLERIGGPLTGHQGSVISVAISPDGKTLASGSLDNNILLWKLDTQSWIEKTCQRAGRNFTAREWENYGFTEPYRKTCEQWPLEVEIPLSPSITP